MRQHRLNRYLILGMLLIVQPLHWGWSESALDAPSDTYVLIVGGLHKAGGSDIASDAGIETNEIKRQDGLIAQLRQTFILSSGIAAERIHVLTPPSSSISFGNGPSTLETIRTTLRQLKEAIQRNDRFIFYYIGQANIVNESLRFNLPGPDLTHEVLAADFESLHASTIVVILDCPGAGIALPALAKPGRTIVCAARSDQPYRTFFSDYFIPSLVDPSSDTDANRRISLLEAFANASRQVDEYYRSQEYLKTETAILDDNGDGEATQQPWLYRTEEVDGKTAAEIYLSQ